MCGKESAKMLVCAGTCEGLVKYCSTKCQKEHWRVEHKSQCSKVDPHHVCRILTMLGQTVETVSVIKQCEVSIAFQGDTQKFKFDDERQSSEFTKEYAMLTTEIKELPNCGLEALRQIQRITAFTNRWGPSRVPKRIAAHSKQIKTLLTCPICPAK